MSKRDKRYLILLVVFIIAFCFLYNAIDARIVRKGYVKKVEDNIISIVDLAGNVWEWEAEDNEAFTLGEHVKLVMNNNHTIDTIEDDIIVKIVIDKMYK